MNKTEVTGNWNEQIAKLKQRFASLKENDLRFEEDKEEEMNGKPEDTLTNTGEEQDRIRD